MFCNNCGKEILSDDQFCPYCGKRVNQKKIVIDSNASLDSLQKRGMLLLEDGDFSSADEFFNRVLSLDPENYYGYLGKQMIKHKLRFEDDFYSFYKKLFSDDLVQYTEVCDEDLLHVDEMVSKYSIDNYLEKEAIKRKYQYDRTVGLKLPIREQQKRQIEKEFSTDTGLVRIERYADENNKKKIDSIFEEYDNRIKEAKISDEKTIQAVKDAYKAHLEKTDIEIKNLYDKAVNDRENDYTLSIEILDNSTDLGQLKNALDSFLEAGEYKDSSDYASKTKTRITEIETVISAERRKRNIIITVLICIIGILSLAFYRYYETTVVPKNKYNNAISLVENEKYDEAISIFKELGDYEDSEEKLTEAEYLKGCNLLNSGEYTESIAIFEQLGDYKESKENIKEAKYQIAIDFYNNKNIKQSVELFNELKDFKETKDYLDKINDEYIYLENYKGKQFSEISSFLKENGIDYYLVKVNTSGKDSVIDTNPSFGFIRKDEKVRIKVSLGNTDLNKYYGDGNWEEIFKVKVTKAGDKVRVRTFPVALSDLSNKIANLSEGSVQSVYEILEETKYTWYRIGNRRWIATEKDWVSIQ